MARSDAARDELEKRTNNAELMAFVAVLNMTSPLFNGVRSVSVFLAHSLSDDCISIVANIPVVNNGDDHALFGFILGLISEAICHNFPLS
jgi:hypothetical protein